MREASSDSVLYRPRFHCSGCGLLVQGIRRHKCPHERTLHLAKQGVDIPIRHTMQILRDAYAGS